MGNRRNGIRRENLTDKRSLLLNENSWEFEVSPILNTERATRVFDGYIAFSGVDVQSRLASSPLPGVCKDPRSHVMFQACGESPFNSIFRCSVAKLASSESDAKLFASVRLGYHCGLEIRHTL